MVDDAADLVEDLHRPVVGALGGTGVEHHDVGLGAGTVESVLNHVGLVGHDGVHLALAAPSHGLTLDDQAVRLDVLAAAELLARSHELVARGDEHDLGLREDLALGEAGARQGGCHDRRHESARTHDYVALVHATARRRGAGIAGARCMQDGLKRLVIVAYLGVLDAHGRVEALGHADARVCELPLHAAGPAGDVGHLAGLEPLEVAPAKRHRVHVAGQTVGQRHLCEGVHGKRAPKRLVHRHGLVRRMEIAGGEDGRHRVLAVKLDVLRMVPHACPPNSGPRPHPCVHIARAGPAGCRPRTSFFAR